MSQLGKMAAGYFAAVAAVDIGAGIYLLLSHGEYNGMEGILVDSFSAAAGVTIGMWTERATVYVLQKSKFF